MSRYFSCERHYQPIFCCLTHEYFENKTLLEHDVSTCVLFVEELQFISDNVQQFGLTVR